ncbi:MBL fold metallo-hydrolase [Coralliovum pocilloporae]|uniref:MBL fold metallo-hydrolase n=1 Tax=Coralliovum pocilloporae TaxID=3066369 RepID=UPI003307C419
MPYSSSIAQNFVALLGTKGGPAIRPGSSSPTANLLMAEGRPVVVDCGLGVTRGLIDQGVELEDLGLIFITHLHSDHYLDLGPLLHTAWTAGLKTPVDIYGPEGLEDYWLGFLQSMKADIDLRIEDEGRPDLATLVNIHVLDDGQVLQEHGLTVSALRNEHPPLIDTFALSFKWAARHVVFSGDTAYFPPLAPFARGCDLLIHEAMLSPALDALVKRVGNTDGRLMRHLLRSHTPVEDAGRIATEAGVRALALHHLIPADDADYGEADWLDAIKPHWDGPLFVGRDGLRIPLG